MDTELELQQDPPQNDPPELTDEQKAQAAEDERRRRDAQYEQFKPFMDAFDGDPSKAFKAAMEGKIGGQPPQPPPQYQPPPQEQQQWTDEQLREANAKAFAALAENPLGVLAQLQQTAEQRAYDRVVRDAAPILDSNGDRLVRDFKKDKKDEDPYYKMVVGEFENEMEDLPPGELIRMTPAQQRKELDRRYAAAQGRVLSQKVRPVRQGATSAGNGTTMTHRNGTAKVVELTQSEKAALWRNLGKEGGDQAIKDIEEGR